MSTIQTMATIYTKLLSYTFKLRPNKKCDVPRNISEWATTRDDGEKSLILCFGSTIEF